MSNELGEFLRTRRARVRPQDVGLPGGGRRRVPGLRRDELAVLAGVSVEYYTRLEQGRGGGVSDAVLDAIAQALSLDETEREHLRTLVRPTRRARPSPRGAQVRSSIHWMLERMNDIPAVVFDCRMDVLAWNRLGSMCTSADGTGLPNMARHVFLDPAARTFYVDWTAAAADTVGYLRLSAGNHPGDQRLAALVGELSIQSREFRELWARHDVKDKTAGSKRMNHPLVGELELGYEAFPVAGSPGLTLIVYVPEPGSASEEKLALMASWSAPEHERPAADRRGHAVTADDLEE